MSLFTYTRAALARKGLLRPLSAALTISLAGVAACSELGGPSEPSTSVTGSYTLANVGGNTLPTMIYEGPYTINGQRVNLRLAMHNGTLQLNGNRYQFQLGIVATVGGQNAPLPFTDQGTYTKNGSQIAFRSDDASVGSFAGSLDQAGLSVLIDLVGDKHPPVYQFRK